jgi:hypothetical protein
MLLLIPPRTRLPYPEDEPAPAPPRRLLVRGLATMTTCGLTAWACTLGWIPAILALMTAKHVLVAILLMDLGVDRSR